MRGSIHAKVFALIAVVAIALIIGLASFFTGRYVDATHRELDERLRIYSQLAAHELVPVLEFDDRQTLREIMASLGADEEVAAIAVYRDDGTLVGSRGELGAPDTKRIAALIHGHSTKGTVVIEMSTALVDAEIANANRGTLLVTALALALALTGAWLVGRHLAVRLGSLASMASKVVANATMESDTPFTDESSDEIGRLSGSFNTMVGRLLAAQSREIELLLENVTEGFVIVDAKGNMGAHHSAVMDRWFGSVEKGMPLWRLFAEHDPNAAAYLELGWEALFDGFLPPEVALDQFPKRLKHGESIFELVIQPIKGENGDVTSALVVLTDVTAAIRRAEVDATRGDVLALCERALADKSAVVDFVMEGDSILRVILEAERLIEMKRAVHTLKGVAGQIGAVNIAACCETIEDGMVVSETGKPRSQDVATLTTRWQALTAHLRTLFDRTSGEVYVERVDLDQLLGRVEAHAPHAELARQTKLLRLEPMQVRLDRQKQAADALAKRLGKDIEITGSAGRLRSDPAVWAPFWNAFTHVVRNAVDHGIEPVEKRLKRGKPARAKIRIDIVRSSSCVMIGATDDGGGIDWFKVAKKAVLHGLPAETPADLESALFFDGLSTCDDVNDVSGRGIGMGAIRAVTESMGGTVAIESRTGHGTTVRFTIPVTALGDAYTDISPRAVAA